MSPPEANAFGQHLGDSQRSRSLRGRDRGAKAGGDDTPSRPLSPFPGTPSRATVSTSSVSVSTRVDSSPRRVRDTTVSSTVSGLLSPPALSPAASDSGRASPGSALSVSAPSVASASGVSLQSGGSRKGKERADPSVPVPDPEPDTEVDETDARGEVSAPSTGDVRRGLRELVQRDTRPRGHSRAASSRGELRCSTYILTRLRRAYPLKRPGPLLLAKEILCADERWQASAGNVGHCSRLWLTQYRGHPDDDSMTNMMGVAQALISIFAEDDDRPRSVLRGQTQITFVLKPQLYLFAVSDWGEPEYVVSSFLHSLTSSN